MLYNFGKWAFSDISYRSRVISKKLFSGVIVCQIRDKPGFLEAALFTIVCRRCVLPNIKNASSRKVDFKPSLIGLSRRVQAKRSRAGTTCVRSYLQGHSFNVYSIDEWH